MAKDKRESIETTLACTAFAEEGAPCPLCGEKEKNAESPQALLARQGSLLDSVENDFACTAFHDQNEECPIPTDRR